MKGFTYLIIGGGIAGGKACEGIREIDQEGSIALITKEDHPPYQRPPLSKGYLKDEVGLDRIYLQSAEKYRDMGLELMQGKEVTALSPQDHIVTLEDGDQIAYEKLLLATGGSAIRLPIWGNELENVFTLRSIEDAKNIRKAAGANTRALVMGGSFIGAEVSATISQLDAQVVAIFPESRLLEHVVPEELSKYLHDLYEKHHVRLLPETVSEGLEGETSVQQAILSNGERLDVDLVVMGVGIKLNTNFAKGSGLDIQQDGSIPVNDKLQTTHPDIFAAGDITAWLDPNAERRLHVEHWDVARRQGRVAGRNMAGSQETYSALPYFFSDLYDLSFEVWGELTSWDQTVQRGTFDEGSFSFFYFDQGRLKGVLAVNRSDEERTAMKKLPKEQPTYDEVADKLQDQNFKIEELVT
jgi:NADPH-dependent 2,4-dienoyl-CoA reductase/sulfur reductase-like enzyme